MYNLHNFLASICAIRCNCYNSVDNISLISLNSNLSMKMISHLESKTDPIDKSSYLNVTSGMRMKGIRGILFVYPPFPKSAFAWVHTDNWLFVAWIFNEYISDIASLPLLTANHGVINRWKVFCMKNYSRLLKANQLGL